MKTSVKVKIKMDEYENKVFSKFLITINREWLKRFYKDNNITEYSSDSCYSAMRKIFTELAFSLDNTNTICVELETNELKSFTEFVNSVIREDLEEVFSGKYSKREARACDSLFWRIYRILENL